MKITKSDFSEAKHSNMKLQKGKDSQEAAYLYFRTLHFEFLIIGKKRHAHLSKNGSNIQKHESNTFANGIGIRENLQGV